MQTNPHTPADDIAIMFSLCEGLSQQAHLPISVGVTVGSLPLTDQAKMLRSSEPRVCVELGQLLPVTTCVELRTVVVVVRMSSAIILMIETTVIIYVKVLTCSSGPSMETALQVISSQLLGGPASSQIQEACICVSVHHHQDSCATTGRVRTVTNFCATIMENSLGYAHSHLNSTPAGTDMSPTR